MEHAANILALLTRLEVMLGKLGMSPADRPKVSILKTDGADNPYGGVWVVHVI